jgi:hypothetical protein
MKKHPYPVFNPLFAGTSTTTSAPPNTRDAKTMLADFRAVLDRVESEEKRYADNFRELARKHGFDLDAGDVMIVPSTLDLHIPACFKAKAVRQSPLANAVYFIRRDVASL